MAIVELIKQYNVEERQSKFSLSSSRIKEMIDFDLPDDYLEFIYKYKTLDDFIGEQSVIIYDANMLYEINNDYDITNNLSNTIVIGGNGGGELIGIEYIKERVYEIVLLPAIGMDDKSKLIIGQSFTDMFIRLKNGKQWFDEK